MIWNWTRRALAGALAAALLAVPALAAEPEAPAQVPGPWAYDALADSYAMGLVDDDYSSYIQSPVTQEQLEAMTAAAADKLALLELPQRPADAAGLVVDTTRGGVMNALYQEAAAYDIDGVEAIDDSQTVIFELDLNDTEGMAYLQGLMLYSDGTTLADRISPELYERCQAAWTAVGMPAESLDLFKPWALASTFGTLGLQDDTTSANMMAIDSYINAKAVNAGKEIAAVETYAFQGGIFDGLTPEYQEAYLEASLTGLEALLSGEAATEEAQTQAQAQQEQIAAMFEAWKDRDPEAFAAVYNKQAVLDSDDELNAKLFTERDPGMIAAAAEYLETEGENTFFLAVGAGHMVDPGGIVSGLQELGYTVELAP